MVLQCGVLSRYPSGRYEVLSFFRNHPKGVIPVVKLKHTVACIHVVDEIQYYVSDHGTSEQFVVHKVNQNLYIFVKKC